MSREPPSDKVTPTDQNKALGFEDQIIELRAKLDKQGELIKEQEAQNANQLAEISSLNQKILKLFY